MADTERITGAVGVRGGVFIGGGGVFRLQTEEVLGGQVICSWCRQVKLHS